MTTVPEPPLPHDDGHRPIHPVHERGRGEVGPADYIELTASRLAFSKAPRKLGIPVQRGEQFENLVEALTRRVESLGITSAKTPEGALILSLEANQGVIKTEFLGNARLQFQERLDELFGEGKWSFEHLIQGRLLDRNYALGLYEEAYIHYFTEGEGKELLPWLETFSDVYDTAPSNIGTYDYEEQECPEKGHHIHDIAIRRALKAIKFTFKGTEPLHVRGPNSEGFALSPGKIPFHRPELIPDSPMPGRAWWEAGSIEDFYQRTRRLVVEEFRDDSSFPSNPQEAQHSRSYYQRVAARSILRMLPIFQDRTVDISNLNELPWMIDHASFPLGDNGLPRPFSEGEVFSIVEAGAIQLETLFKSGKHDETLLDKWLGFKRVRDYLEIVGRWSLNGPKGLTSQQHNDYPDFKEIGAWGKALPCFAEHISSSGRRPLFLARDGLAVMEYMAYRNDLSGLPRETVEQSVYLPGNFNRKLPKNQRADFPPLERMVNRLFNICNEIYEELQLDSPPETDEEAKSVWELFVKKVYEYFDQEKEGRDFSDGLHPYNLWDEAYDQIRNTFNKDLSDIIVVDTDGTGKSVLFIKTMLEYFGQERGEDVDIDCIVGALQKRHLGIPRLDKIHGLEPIDSGGNVVPDIRWPFRFIDFDPEPTFTVRLAPVMQLQLLWRSLEFYNFAARDVAKG